MIIIEAALCRAGYDVLFSSMIVFDYVDHRGDAMHTHFFSFSFYFFIHKHNIRSICIPYVSVCDLSPEIFI